MKRKKLEKRPTGAAPPQVGRGAQMLIEERRQHILALAHQNGRAIREDLSLALGIPRITIRKDLDYLQRKGPLQRTHGGALLPQSGALFDPSLKEEEGRHLEENQGI